MSGVHESSNNFPRLTFPVAAVPHGVGDQVARERRRRRWSQAKLASRAGLSRAAVYRVEGGARPVRPDTLFRLAHALDLPIRGLVPDWPEWEPIKGLGHGEAVRERRRSLGLTIAELAEKVKVSEATLSRHERSVGVSPSFLIREGDEVLARNNVLSVALDELADQAAKALASQSATLCQDRPKRSR